MTEAKATQQPIQSSTETLEEVLAKLPQVEASPKEVLELKPNTAADATSGPDAQIDPNTYVSWTKPDGSTFIAPLANSETYERKGYTKGAEQKIEDLVAHNAEQAKQEAASEPKPATSTRSTAKTAAESG